MSVRFTRKYMRDLCERIVVTFMGGVIAAWIVAPFDPSNWKNYAVGLVAAGLSALKGLAAKTFGDPQSASLTD